MQTGIIARVLLVRGFGFLKPDSGEADVFFHSSSLVRLAFAKALIGQRVEFVVTETMRGPRAQVVQPVTT